MSDAKELAGTPVNPDPLPDRVPPTVRFPLVVSAPFDATVRANVPSVKSIVPVRKDVPTVTSPLASNAPFISNVVAVISTSVFASISNCPSAEE